MHSYEFVAPLTVAFTRVPLFIECLVTRRLTVLCPDDFMSVIKNKRGHIPLYYLIRLNGHQDTVFRLFVAMQ